MSKEIVFTAGQLVKHKNVPAIGVVVRRALFAGQHIVKWDNENKEVTEWSGDLVPISKRPPVYTVEPGREIQLDGVPLVYIGTNPAVGFTASPSEADALTHLIVKLLNEHVQKNA
jgi:hypothetical protein